MTPVAALQATIGGEHAAVYLYGVLGGLVSDSADPSLGALIDARYNTHVGRRDRLSQLISAHGVLPAASAVAYALPNPAATSAQQRAIMRQVEQRCTTLYGQLVSATTGADRAWAITTLQAGAVDETTVGLAPTDFPGMSGPLR